MGTFIDVIIYSNSFLMPGKITIKKKWSNNELVNQLYLMRNQRRNNDLSNSNTKHNIINFNLLIINYY